MSLGCRARVYGSVGLVLILGREKKEEEGGLRVNAGANRERKKSTQ